ncbi:hypothetical protein Pcinc_002585 [Petrolisthes cinctipes]|uniref:Uncharacterized protein n=1 Tax=Petrolisthes cinctipes TaxID=88211 RepID=A0AAE1GKM8_PETCI|nr:hypothetical protein Pcinc_002585 [Petrolisthes cinctipes]
MGESEVVTLHSLICPFSSHHLVELVISSLRTSFQLSGSLLLYNSGDTDCTGYVGILLMLLASSLNLTIDNAAIKSCGVADVQGTRVTVIQQGNADIALGTCSITANRLRVVDFTEFFKVIRSSIVTALPNIIQSPFMIFNVLSWHVDMVVSVHILGGGGRDCVGGRESVVRMRPDLYLAAGDAIAVTTKAFIFQGINNPRVLWRGGFCQLDVGNIWVVAVDLGPASHYLLLSIHPRYERAVNSLADLAERPQFTPVVNRNDPKPYDVLGKYTISSINRTVGLLGYFATRLVFSERYENLQLTQDIVAGKATFFNSDRLHLRMASTLNKALGHEGRWTPCGIHLAAQDLRQDYLGLMISKNSWFKEQINQRIRWLRSFGIVSHLYQQFNPPGCLLKVPRQQGGGVLTLRQLQGAFWVWLSGIYAAIIIFLFERVSRFLCSG